MSTFSINRCAAAELVIGACQNTVAEDLIESSADRPRRHADSCRLRMNAPIDGWQPRLQAKVFEPAASYSANSRCSPAQPCAVSSHDSR